MYYGLKPVGPDGKKYDPDERARTLGVCACRDDSLTVQSQSEEADINVIVRRFGLTGVLPQAVVPPEYGDFDGPGDYRTCLDLIHRSQAAFEALPVEARNRFKNDAAEFMDWVHDPKRTLEELDELRLADPEKVSKARVAAAQAEIDRKAAEAAAAAKAAPAASGAGK